MGRAWYDLLLIAVWLGAYLVPRYVLRPERHPWEIWIPAAVAIALIVGGLATEDWALAGVFCVVVAIEIWRTFPLWRHLKSVLPPSHTAQ